MQYLAAFLVDRTLDDVAVVPGSIICGFMFVFVDFCRDCFASAFHVGKYDDVDASACLDVLGGIAQIVSGCFVFSCVCDAGSCAYVVGVFCGVPNFVALINV